MVLYECQVCNFSTNLNSNFKRHLKTQKHQKRISNENNYGVDNLKTQNYSKKDPKETQKRPVLAKKETQKRPKKTRPGPNIGKIESNQEFFCENCEKSFKNKTHLYRHIKHRCRGKLYKTDEITELKNIIQEQKKIYQDEKKEKEQLFEYIGQLIEKTGDTNINFGNNIGSQTNNQINLNNFGEEDISHITDSFKMNMLKLPYGMVQKMIESVHFDKNKPENRNIALTNKRDKMIKVLHNGCWKYKDKDVTLDELIKNNYYILDEYYEEIAKEKMNATHNKRYKTFQEKFDNQEEDLMDRIKKDTEMILLSDNLTK